MENELKHVRKLKEKNGDFVKAKSNIVQKKRTYKEQLRHAWEHLKKSMADVGKDSLLMLKLWSSGVSNLSLGEFLTYKQIQRDLLKFLPFSLFVLIPVGEVFLPVYLYLFPNATPSQFYSEKSVGQMVSAKVKLQRKAYEILRFRLRRVMKDIFRNLQEEVNNILLLDSAEQREQRLQELDLKMVLHMATRWDKYGPQLAFSKLSLYEKECVLSFLFNDFVSGVNILNRLLNLPRVIYSFWQKMSRKRRGLKPPKPESGMPKPRIDMIKYPKLNKSFHGFICMNFFPFSLVRSWLLDFQIKQHIKTMERQDQFLLKNPLDQLESCSKQQVFQLSKTRGSAHLNNEDEKEFLMDYWIYPKIAAGSELPKNDLLSEKWADWEFRFWAMVLRHNYQSHLI